MTMKLLIVEDEQIALDNLRNIDWKSEEIELIGAASNGVEAMKYVKEFKPQIVISDIKMPEMSGIELAGKIATLLPDTKIIIISAYTDFSYTQKAIAYGVFEYILKPYTVKSLIETVNNAKTEIESEKKKNDIIADISSRLEFSKYFMREYYLNSVSMPKLSEDFVSMFGNTGENRRYIAISVVLDESDDSGYYKKNFGLFTDIEKIIIKNQACVAFFDIFNFAYILSFENETNEKCIGLTLDIADLIKEHMEFSCLSDYVIGVGNPVANRKSIRQSLSSAQNAASYSFYLGKRNVIYISDIEQNTEVYNYRSIYDDNFFNSIKIGDSDTVNETIEALFDAFAQNTEDISIVQRTCHNIIVNLSVCLMQCGQDPNMLFNKTDIWSLIQQHNDINQMKKFISDTISVVMSAINYARTNRALNIVDETKKYISENISASAGDIADHFHLSQSYLSIVFSKGSDVTLKNYIINERIKYAKDMLLNSDKTVYEIAHDVGYKTAQHFSVVFKKLTGLTPSAFQSEHKHV